MATAGSAPILPGATIGVFGSGQLGRMMALAARCMGYRVATFSPTADSPTGQVADYEHVAGYDDEEALRAFASRVDVATFEFENVPARAAEIAEACNVPVRPGGWVVHTAQHRAREKTFLAGAGLPVAPFALVNSLDQLNDAVARLGAPTVLKTAAFGYDGKGQVVIEHVQDTADAWAALGVQDAVLEAFVPFTHELSVVAARGVDGAFAHYGAIENIHANHILDVSIAPARLPQSVADRAVDLARHVLEKLDVVGVLCVEFFLQENGELLINELAPRPHNSGHLTIDAAVTSQFEQQVRAVCGLPLGRAPAGRELLSPAVMANLLGDLWAHGEPDWVAALNTDVKFHLYGKAEARPGRKMGHITSLHDDVDYAVATVLDARRRLTRAPVSEE